MDISINTTKTFGEGTRAWIILNVQLEIIMVCFVAEDSGKIIGVILCGHDGRRGFIYHTAVHVNYRNQGIARNLVKSAIKSHEVEG
ncbi:MAG: GNAT family N-acetyltransferase [Anaerocolumna sp.]